MAAIARIMAPIMAPIGMLELVLVGVLVLVGFVVAGAGEYARHGRRRL